MKVGTGDLDRWVEAGLVSPDQAARIRAFEAGESSAEGPAGPIGPPSAAAEPEARFTLAAEVASYVGTVLALTGGAVVVGSRWQEVGWPGQLAIALTIAVIGFGAGAWLRSLREPGTDRFSGVTWVLGTGGSALSLGVVLHEWRVDGSVAAISIGTLVLGIGVGSWRNLDRPLQFLTALAGGGILIGGLADLTDVVWPYGLATWPAAAALFVAAHGGRVVSRATVLAGSGVAALLSCAMLSDLDEHLGPAAAAVTAIAIVVFGLVDRLTTVLVVGVVGFLFASQSLLATTFDSVAASGIVTLVGLAIVVLAVVRSVRGSQRS